MKEDDSESTPSKVNQKQDNQMKIIKNNLFEKEQLETDEVVSAHDGEIAKTLEDAPKYKGVLPPPTIINKIRDSKVSVDRDE